MSWPAWHRPAISSPTSRQRRRDVYRSHVRAKLDGRRLRGLLRGAITFSARGLAAGAGRNFLEDGGRKRRSAAGRRRRGEHEPIQFHRDLEPHAASRRSPAASRTAADRSIPIPGSGTGWGRAISGDYPLWVATIRVPGLYPHDPVAGRPRTSGVLRSPLGFHRLRQVPGVTVPVDLDVFNGSADALGSRAGRDLIRTAEPRALQWTKNFQSALLWGHRIFRRESGGGSVKIVPLDPGLSTNTTWG